MEHSYDCKHQLAKIWYLWNTIEPILQIISTAACITSLILVHRNLATSYYTFLAVHSYQLVSTAITLLATCIALKKNRYFADTISIYKKIIISVCILKLLFHIASIALSCLALYIPMYKRCFTISAYIELSCGFLIEFITLCAKQFIFVPMLRRSPIFLVTKEDIQQQISYLTHQETRR